MAEAVAQGAPLDILASSSSEDDDVLQYLAKARGSRPIKSDSKATIPSNQERQVMQAGCGPARAVKPKPKPKARESGPFAFVEGSDEETELGFVEGELRDDDRRFTDVRSVAKPQACGTAEQPVVVRGKPPCSPRAGAHAFRREPGSRWLDDGCARLPAVG
jgi:hypothetical protein